MVRSFDNEALSASSDKITVIIDFQHHYVPYELASRRGVTTRDRLALKEGSLPKSTLPERL